MAAGGADLLAAALRLSTLDLQSFWYDEAFTPVHDLHPSLGATLHDRSSHREHAAAVVRLGGPDARVSAPARSRCACPRRWPGSRPCPSPGRSARELGWTRARRSLLAALVAVNPLFVWYSQEARAYELFVLTAALALLCFLRAEREPTRGAHGGCSR